MTKRQMRLSGFCQGNGSYHQAGWRHPDARPEHGSSYDLWVETAKKMEAAKFDMMFVADIISPPDAEQPDIFPFNSAADRLEPMTWLAGLAAHTKHLGLAGTIATSYRPPYDVARELASLDLISGGRAAWNIVTGIAPEDATQYADQVFPPQADRYEKGEEFVDVVLKLWASVEPGAFRRDKQSGTYTDAEKVHLIRHAGRFFNVRGPLGIEPSPQRRPVLAQAGQSEEGRRLAARVGEIIFTAQSDFTAAKAYYDDIRSRASALGRNPDHVKILPGCMVITGESRAEADEKWAQLNELIDLRPARTRLQMALKFVDLSDLPLDAPFPEMPPEAVISRGMNHVEAARREGLSLREVLIRSSASNAHLVVRGTAADVVDQMEHWFTGGACDGFNLMPAVMPTSLDDFIAAVLPELRRRELFRTEYEGTTLRANLGLPADPIPLRH
ncbi:LLM class flavin-dependent oxidoreductase [Sphingomonas crocodyli]|uniref:LLM class flavin-dependent oxidoreductase n=1 Tax=Sphingomonas crocodyli TaxID=1979270 RepID=A0A437M662_9SPHN|nr:LLM class flavin-dependent oxidoreductase [Sphingomonas crocodyli]RVT93045.1 LLM class flavin-dependent oxidoreductase [Sphingomonas crocodyli]